MYLGFEHGTFLVIISNLQESCGKEHLHTLYPNPSIICILLHLLLHIYYYMHVFTGKCIHITYYLNH
jgi:uncharacterized damage-inducible protein DinB